MRQNHRLLGYLMSQQVPHIHPSLKILLGVIFSCLELDRNERFHLVRSSATKLLSHAAETKNRFSGRLTKRIILLASDLKVTKPLVSHSTDFLLLIAVPFYLKRKEFSFFILRGNTKKSQHLSQSTCKCFLVPYR